MKEKVRPAAVAGRFYPADPAELRRLVSSLLSAVPGAAAPAPKALIAPHAGYAYSGPVAASAFSRLAPAVDVLRRVVLIGPSHFVDFSGIAASSATRFQTPLGSVAVDTSAFSAVSDQAHFIINDQAHAHEHALETHLPFLQVVLRDFAIVPLVVGTATDTEVHEIIEALWGGPETVVVVSSDLSHYYDAQTARRLDQATAQAIESLSPEAIGEDRACGRLPIRGLLRAGRRHSLRVRTLDLRNSGDTAGPRHQVVGYGAFSFEIG